MPDQAQLGIYRNARTACALQEETPRVGAIFENRFNKPKVNAIEHAMSQELG